MTIFLNFIRRWQNWLVFFVICTIIVVVVRLYPHPPLSDKLSFSTAFYDQNHKLLRITLSDDAKYRTWTPLAEISPLVVDGLLLHEDQWFYYHPGINPSSLLRAFWQTYIGGGNRQGASTITMQVARMYWNLNTKTIDGKLIQMARALQLELMYSKDEILEAYLNYAPFGRNIEGIGAASLVYFDKPPAKLNLPEALTLTVLPQSPTFRVDKTTGIAGEKLVQARNRLFARWQEKQPIDESMAALFEQPLLMRQPEQLPFLAPHFVDQIVLQNIDNVMFKRNSNIITTLDSNLQSIVEQQISAFVERNQIKGINNASAILVDSDNMEVKALVGSANYFNNPIHGQVNGTTAKRSPGSTLKPFIYALGFDQGVLHPMTVLKDVETDFGFYTPENFDRKFKGPISATQALISSRNIPAVYVASKLKKPTFYQFLQQAHIQNLATEQHYGLALVLGGGEVTSQELAQLYALLNNQGKWQPLRFIRPANSNLAPPTSQLLSPEASFMTKDMLLKNTRRQDILFKKQNTALPIFWKTGTSWGFRDAWTAGGFKQYILVVWLGNFDGSSNNAFVGVDAATPLFFNIIDAINGYYPNTQISKTIIPPNLKKVDICLASGNLVTQWCKVKGKSWFIPGVSPITVDNVYRPVRIDNDTGRAVCPPYDPVTSKIEVFEYWPSDLAKIFAKAGIPKKTPPSNANCSPLGYLGEPPKILSPLKNVTYQFRANNLKQEKIILNANSDADAKKLYWFVDNQFIGNTTTTKPLEWSPTKSGLFKLLVVDDLGRSDSRMIKVELIH